MAVSSAVCGGSVCAIAAAHVYTCGYLVEVCFSVGRWDGCWGRDNSMGNTSACERNELHDQLHVEVQREAVL